jgi:hypothetical protein
MLRLCEPSDQSRAIYEALKNSILAGALDEACGQRAAKGSKVEQFLWQLIFAMSYCEFSVERYCGTTVSIL